MTEGAFSWLHLSDIHVGMGQQDWLWPRYDTLLMTDLELVHKKSGSIDVLVFSGDLTQQALQEEFDRFDEIINRIRARLRELGSDPKIVAVPGNHDLSRPSPQNPHFIALQQFHRDEGLRRGFWNECTAKPGSKEEEEGFYKTFIDKVFERFVAWQNKAIADQIHVDPVQKGLLPGDAAYLIPTAIGQCGIIGLNSSWLQLGASDYSEQLHVDTRQLLALTDNKPDQWVASNAANLIVCHHPVDWLTSASREQWAGDIYPAGRFDLHLFGHMHEPNTVTTSYGGGAQRRAVQGASLFGLETYGDGSSKRIQGYSANRINSEERGRLFTSWPRILYPKAGGGMRIVADQSQEIHEETSSFTLALDKTTHSLPQEILAKQPISGTMDLIDTQVFEGVALGSPNFDLTIIQSHLPEGRAHHKIRRLELQRCIAALEENGAAWLAADWGMGEEGFISTIRSHFDLLADNVFRIDLGEYRDRQGFLGDVQAQLGASFEQICQAISDAGPGILVLELTEAARSGNELEDSVADIEDLVSIVRDFAPETFILLHALRAPRRCQLSVVELSTLDEADVAIYVRESELGGERYGKPDAAGVLYRHTDGIPTRLDVALRDLEFVSLNGLLSSNPDYGEAGANMISAPPALVAIIGALKHSEDRAERRAYSLLLALSALPKGEQLERIRRFLGPHAFHPLHARILLERALVSTISLHDLQNQEDGAIAKALVVPRPIRDYVRDTLEGDVADRIDRSALELYFGADWKTGEIMSSPSGRRVRLPLCDGYEIQNGSTLIVRKVRRALVENDSIEAEAAIRLASAFVECLISGDHFRSAAALCQDVLIAIEEVGGHEAEVNILRYELARSMRMTGRVEAARDHFEQLDMKLLSKPQRQQSDLGLAFCHEKLGDTKEAAAAAARVIAIDKTSRASIQAESIIVEQIEDRDKRIAGLHRLLAKARKNDANVTANNLQLTIAKELRESDSENVIIALNEVISRARSSNDYYNEARSIVDLSDHDHRKLTSKQFEKLKSAYHYLYQERLYDIFNKCHRVLWSIFTENGDIQNLLNLFRHSSFIWRLNGRDDQERIYLQKLARMAQHLIIKDIRHASRDSAYFVIRVTVVLGDLVPVEAKALPN